MIPTFIGAMLERLKAALGFADALQREAKMRNLRPFFRTRAPDSSLLVSTSTAAVDSFPPMRRLMTPVNAGMSAARHVFWYLTYHAAADRRPGS